MEFFIGLDIGTSAVKGALMRADGEVVTTKSAPFSYAIEGSAKLLDPAHFTETCFSVIRELSSQADGRVAAICSCCAAGDILFLDADMKPLSRIVGWQTQIPQADLDAVYTKEEQDAFYRRVGWPFLSCFPAADLAYVKLHRPELLENAAMLVMHAEYLNYHLTGKWGMSRSMGTPSYLMDQEKGAYSDFMLERFSLSEKMLPPIYDKGTVLGTVLPETAAALGLDGDCAVVLGSFDHPSGALGAGVLEPGQLLLSCGTSWVELFPVPDREHAISTGGLVDRFSLYGPKWCVMKSLESVSDKIDRLREHFFGKVPHKVFDGLAGEGEPGYTATNYVGRGVVAVKGNDTILCGNAKLMAENGVDCTAREDGGTVVYVAKNGEFLGAIRIADELREESREVLSELRKQGARTILFTGDSEAIAANVAKQAGIAEYRAQMLPQDKAVGVDALCAAEGKREAVCFVGDGINDAPVLMRADVGIAMGGVGSDAAIEASDVVLMRDDLRGIPAAKRIARKTMRIVRQNVGFALAVKLAILLLSALGVANLWISIFGDVGVAVLAILNAMRANIVKDL